MYKFPQEGQQNANSTHIKFSSTPHLSNPISVLTTAEQARPITMSLASLFTTRSKSHHKTTIALPANPIAKALSPVSLIS